MKSPIIKKICVNKYQLKKAITYLTNKKENQQI